MYEAEVQRMEREEMELIDRLKNTKLLEEATKNEIENAKVDDPASRMNKSTASASNRKGTSSKQGSRRFR